MIVDNFETIKKYINPNPDYYWFLQIISRRKDNSNLPRCEKYIKDYYIQTPEQLEQLKNEITELSKFFNARVYFHPAARSFKKMAFSLVSEATKRFLSDEFKIHRLTRTISGGTSAIVGGTKYWMIDVDSKDSELVKTTVNIIESCSPYPEVNDIISSVSGYHIITKPFNCIEYTNKFKSLNIQDPPEIHKNSPILAYYNGIRK